MYVRARAEHDTAKEIGTIRRDGAFLGTAVVAVSAAGIGAAVSKEQSE